MESDIDKSSDKEKISFELYSLRDNNHKTFIRNSKKLRSDLTIVSHLMSAIPFRLISFARYQTVCGIRKG